MKLVINAVNFEMAQHLEEFIQKKTHKLAKFVREDEEVEVRLTVVKPQTNLNKEAQIHIGGIFAGKTCDTFEEAVQECIEATERQLERQKDK